MLLVPFLVFAKAFCLVWFPGISFNMPESELILGKDLQKVKRDVVEGRPLKLFLIEEGQERRPEELMRKSK